MSPKLRAGKENCSVKEHMFDYWILGKDLSVPEEVIKNFEAEARNEFPFDGMMAEIHTLRAVKAYAKEHTGMVAVEN